MDDSVTAPSYFDATGDDIYYRHTFVSVAGQKGFLAMGVDLLVATLVIQARGIETTVSLAPTELRRLAGALLDAADAIKNAERTGNIKSRNPDL